MPTQPLTPERLLLLLIRALAALGAGLLGLAFWHPWQAGNGPDWRCLGLAIACAAVATICSWGFHALKR